MANAKQLPSGNWRARLYVGKNENGKPVYESFTADTKAEAEYLSMERARELARGVRTAKHPGQLTVGEAVHNYIESNRYVLKPKTIREYEGYARRYMQGLMNIRIRDLNVSICQREINREAKRLAPKSIRNAWGLVTTSIHAVIPEWNMNVNLPAKVPKEMNIPTDEQLLELLSDLEGKRMEIPVLIAATTGLRRGEIAALDFKKDFDYKNNRIRVHKSMQHDSDGNWFAIEGAKTERSTRWVDCPEWVMEKIRNLPEDYVPVSAPVMTTGFRRAADAHGLTDLHFHNLRHYYASLLISLSCPDQYIIARMGHSTTGMLRQVYGHIMTEKDKEITSGVNAHFDALKQQYDTGHDTPEDEPTKPQ